MEHAEDELRIMKEYEASVDPEVLSFIKAIHDGEERLNYVTVAFLSDKAAQKIEELTGKNVYSNRVVLDINAVHHIENRHGENGKQDQSMSDINDIARMGYVIMNYDEITFNGETSFNHVDADGNPAPMVQFCKKIDGTYYVVQTASRVKSKRNYIVTAFKKKKQPSNP